MKTHEFDYQEVKRLTMARGLSWAALGKLARFPSSATIYTVKNCRASRATMKAVALALGVPIETLIIDVDETTEETPQ